MKKTKKIIFFTSLILSAFLIATSFYSDFLYDYCFSKGHCPFWMNVLDSAMPMLISFLSIIIFIFSSITYFLKEEVFKSWSKFTYIWIPVSIILTLITPGGSGSFFVSLWDKEMTAIVMSGLYFIISLFLVVFGVIKFRYIKK